MQNNIQIFENKDFGSVPVIRKGDQPWWVLKDVCKALKLTTPRRVAERLDKDEVNLTHITDSIGRKQKTIIVNESGLYAVILRSDKPNAKAFPVTLIAKDYGMTAQAFNKLLHSLKIQYCLGDAWFLYSNYANQGYTVTKTYDVDRKIIAIHTAWTQKGRF